MPPRHPERRRPPEGRGRALGSRARLAPRLRFFRLVLVLVLLLVAGRLVQIQVLESSRYQREASAEVTRMVTIPAVRGGIYDRNGNVLALSVPTKMVVADDFQITDPQQEASELAPLLGVSAATLAGELHRRSGYVPLARQLSVSAAAKVTAGNFPGITVMDNAYRSDPNGQLAQPVLGSTNANGIGDAGLEYQYQRMLAGRTGLEKLVESPAGVVLPGTGAIGRTAPTTGTGLELTIDESLQYEAEQALGAEITASHATGGTAVLMDVKTGQVLSMANLVSSPSGSVQQAPSNLAVTLAYEPGSVFKVVTFSAALQDGLINPNSTFTVPGSLTLDGSTFTDAEPHPTEQLTATQILAQSSNIGTSEIAQMLGENRLLAQVKNLGFGQRTALHFPGESRGILASQSDWVPTDYVDLPIGQVDAVTPLQVLDMMNAVANGGALVQPKLVRARVASGGAVKATAPSASRRVMPASIASELTPMLEQVVTPVGTAPSAAIPGYAVAGKTGTANIPATGHPGFVPHAYMASFVGFAPAEHPVFAAIVVLDRPTPIYGGSVAAPVFSQIMSYALHRYSIPTSPGPPATPTPPAGGAPAAGNVT